MPPLAPFLITIALGYLLGAISFAVIISRRHGVNIFEAGSRNPGATNVKRVLGKKAGNLCFFLDAVKGLLAAGLPQLVWWGQDYAIALGVAGLLAAILGHSFSVFIRFRGGKGVATTIGGMLAIAPVVIIIGALVWVLTFYATRYVSLASILLGLTLPVAAILLNRPHVVVGLTGLLAVILVVRHRSNIRRLLNGTENRFSRATKH